MEQQKKSKVVLFCVEVDMDSAELFLSVVKNFKSINVNSEVKITDIIFDGKSIAGFPKKKG